MDVTRRRFLQTTASVGAVFAPGGVAAAVRPGPVIADVSCSQPAIGVRGALTLLGGIERVVRPRSKVVLKPNMAFDTPPEWGNNTNPTVVLELARLCLEAGAAKVQVVEHPMGRKGCLLRNNVARRCSGLSGVEVVCLDRQDQFREVAVPKGKRISRVEIAAVALDADVVITIPVAKHHSATRVSFSLKNSMGLIWDRAAFHRCGDLHQAIADLATILRPQLTVVDATRAMVTGGPTGPGRVMPLGRIVASTNPVSADAYALGLAPWGNRNLSPTDVRHLVRAERHGLASLDPGTYQVKRKSL